MRCGGLAWREARAVRRANDVDQTDQIISPVCPVAPTFDRSELPSAKDTFDRSTISHEINVLGNVGTRGQVDLHLEPPMTSTGLPLSFASRAPNQTTVLSGVSARRITRLNLAASTPASWGESQAN